STNQETTVADAAGQYRFNDIVPGRYQIEVRVPGFAVRKMDATVVAGAVAVANANLEIGQLSETMHVRGAAVAGAPAAKPAAAAPQRIRVGGNVQGSRLIQQVRPVYPDDLRQQGIQGTVMIRAIISKLGEPVNAQVVNTAIDPRLAQVALDSFRQWRYQPTLLNGEPVETLMTVDITFDLS